MHDSDGVTHRPVSAGGELVPSGSESVPDMTALAEELVASAGERGSATGRDDRIERSADEAVALFWRFVFEKFGAQSR